MSPLSNGDIFGIWGKNMSPLSNGDILCRYMYQLLLPSLVTVQRNPGPEAQKYFLLPRNLHTTIKGTILERICPYPHDSIPF